MPYKDPEKQREYQREYQRQRRTGLTGDSKTSNLMEDRIRIRTAQDVSILLEETLNEVRDADANRFAARLLMPRRFLVSAFEEFGADMVILALLFNVSMEAMMWRLRNLGCL